MRHKTKNSSKLLPTTVLDNVIYLSMSPISLFDDWTNTIYSFARIINSTLRF